MDIIINSLEEIKTESNEETLEAVAKYLKKIQPFFNIKIRSRVSNRALYKTDYILKNGVVSSALFKNVWTEKVDDAIKKHYAQKAKVINLKIKEFINNYSNDSSSDSDSSMISSSSSLDNKLPAKKIFIKDKTEFKKIENIQNNTENINKQKKKNKTITINETNVENTIIDDVDMEDDTSIKYEKSNKSHVKEVKEGESVKIERESLLSDTRVKGQPPSKENSKKPFNPYKLDQDESSLKKRDPFLSDSEED